MRPPTSVRPSMSSERSRLSSACAPNWLTPLRPCLPRGRSYAVAAVLRQLIECEYLLAHFAIDLEQARNWWISTPAQIRKEFETKTMRKAGDFSDTEYWMHCDAGGHPNPKGAFYVEWLDPGRRTWPVAREELSIDLGLHLHRTWNAIDRLLAKHHARYKEVRAAEREKAERAWTEWRASDPVAEGLTALGQATVQLPLDSLQANNDGILGR